MTIDYHGYPDWQPGLGTTELIAAQPLQSVPIGGTLVAFQLDMRPYSSYGVQVTAFVSGVPTNFNNIGVTLSWLLDSALTTEIWHDGWSANSYNQTGSAFDCNDFQTMIQDNVRGPLLTASVSNNGPQSADVAFTVYGSSRTVSGRTLRSMLGNPLTGQQATLSTIAYFSGNVGAGATKSIPMGLAPGEAHIVLNSGAGNNGCSITGVSTLVAWQAVTFTALRERLVLPDESTILRLINNTAGVLNMNVSVVSTRVAQ